MLEVFQIPVVSPDQERVLSSFQPVSLLLECHLDSQQLPVANIVLGLCGT